MTCLYAFDDGNGRINITTPPVVVFTLEKWRNLPVENDITSNFSFSLNIQRFSGKWFILRIPRAFSGQTVCSVRPFIPFYSAKVEDEDSASVLDFAQPAEHVFEGGPGGQEAGVRVSSRGPGTRRSPTLPRRCQRGRRSEGEQSTAERRLDRYRHLWTWSHRLPGSNQHQGTRAPGPSYLKYLSKISIYLSKNYLKYLSIKKPI